MAATSNNRWNDVLAIYDAMVELIWDMAVGGEMSENEAAASDIIVHDYNNFKTYLEVHLAIKAEG